MCTRCSIEYATRCSMQRARGTSFFAGAASCPQQPPRPVSSMIGGLADSRLYSFDMAETVEHVRRVTHAAAVGVR